jgi:hypothetical protein
MYLSEFDICASEHPRLYPDVGADATNLEIAFCLPFNAPLSFGAIVKALSKDWMAST